MICRENRHCSLSGSAICVTPTDAMAGVEKQSRKTFLGGLVVLKPEHGGSSRGGYRQMPDVWWANHLRPKGPGPALVRANGVNHTFFLACDVLQQYAISGAGVLDNRCPQADALQVFLSQLTHRYFQ